MVSINNLLKITQEKNASDLHLCVGQPPILRIDGRLITTDFPPSKIPQSVGSPIH